MSPKEITRLGDILDDSNLIKVVITANQGQVSPVEIVNRIVGKWFEAVDKVIEEENKAYPSKSYTIVDALRDNKENRYREN